MPEPDPRWNLHDTPNPSEKSLSILIPQTEVKDKITLFNAYEEGSLFRDCPVIPDEGLVADFGDYVFTESKGGDQKYLRYWFAENKTEAQKAVPFRSFWKKFGNHRWDPQLEALAFLQNNSFPLSANIIRGGQQGIVTAPRPFVREIFIAEVNEGSRFRLDQFVNPTPLAIGRYPVPQAQPISYDINGVRGSFPPSLHDDVDIPSTLLANATFFGGTAGEESSRLPGQFFPRTNFKRRRPYVLIVEQELANGVWYTERIRVFPPKRPKVTVA